MTKKTIKKGSTVYHKQYGKAEFAGWFDHETKNYAKIFIPGRSGSLTIPRRELSDKPKIGRKKVIVESGWYSRHDKKLAHYYITGARGYRSACGKAKALGSELVVKEGASRCIRCQRCVKNGIGTSLFDFERDT